MNTKSIYTMTAEELEQSQKEAQSEIDKAYEEVQRRQADLMRAVQRERTIAGVIQARMQMAMETK